MRNAPSDGPTTVAAAPWWRSLPGGRLARRLFVLFVAAAMAPLVLSDWVALSAVERIAEDLHQKAHADRTRELSRQVLDRLLAARDVMAALPDPAGDGAPQMPDAVPGLGTTFERLESFDAEGRRQALRSTSSRPPAEPLAPTGGWQARAHTFHTLLVERESALPPRIMLERHVGGRLVWRAELRAAALWSPVLDGAGDTGWRVLDATGRELLRHAPADGLGPDPRLASVALPLDGLFAAGSWQFEHQAPRTAIQFLGSPLASWLGLLALGTVFTVALAAHWRIRRVFQPLEALAEGTRRLAAGDTGTRVAMRASQPDDELRHLACSFNDMATRIDDQLGALHELAAIDHDILRGAPLSEVAQRLVAQVLRTAPGAVVTISWRDCASLDGQPAEPCVHTLRASPSDCSEALQLTGLPSLDELDRHADEAPGTAAGPWLPALPGADWRHAVRAVERNGQVEGLIALALPPGCQPPDRLDALRDRLAVALTARRRDRELAWRATHDSLTGLLNRLGLHESLDHHLAVHRAGAEPAGLALMFIDLDHFKDVNDTRGHDVGDTLLCQVAERLLQQVPATASVARLGGDEFVVLLPGASADAALALATHVCGQLKLAFLIDGISTVIGASAGISMAPEHGQTRLELARRADIALYTAKARRGSVCLFSESLDQAASERAAWVAELREAIVRQEFRLHYQPRVSADNGQVVSVEALVRWQHPRHGLLPPGRFIELAEQAGLMDRLGELVLDEACRQMAAWRRADVPVPKVSVNVSMQQLLTGRLPGLVRETLSRHSLPPSALELEVTESLLADDATSAQRQLRELRNLGVEIALDDFGTGYSAMSQLRRLPIDVMKIDRSFVVDLDHDDGARAIARAIVALAGALRLRVVAEGVETRQQAAWLRELGCHELQGYLFARPMPAEEVVSFVTREPRRSAEPESASLLA